MRRHSVAVMSTSFLTPSLTSSVSTSRGMSPDSGVRASTESTDKKNSMSPTNRVPSSKATDGATSAEAGSRGQKTTPDGATKTSSSPSSASSSHTAAAAAAVKARRHSVAVHPGAAVSVMESGRQAPAQKKSISKSNPKTASDVIDDLIRSADASLIRNSSLPTGSTVLQAAIQELDEMTDERP